MAHITNFLARHRCEYTGQEIFAAECDNGKIRIGYAGGMIKEFPPAMVDILVDELKTAADFATAENILIESDI